jgi:hypothetical protein
VIRRPRTTKSPSSARRSLAAQVAAGLLTVLALAAPRVLYAQVGHAPAASPYEDLRGKQAISLSPGWMIPGGDPAGIGPRNGLMFSGRYELMLTGPLWLTTRIGYAPGLDRTVKDPDAAPGSRIVGTETEPLYLIDAGFGLNLTGNKAWHGIAPRATATLGAVSTLKSAYDVGGYRFGTKFMVSYGLGARIATGSAWEFNADLSHMFWKMDYPEAYGGDGSATDESILGGGKLAPWQGSLLLTAGVTRYFFR